MAFLSLTKKAAAVLKLDVSTAGTAQQFNLPALEDWIVDVIWSGRPTQPGLLFYNRATGFAIPLNLVEYSLGVGLTLIQKSLARLLEEHSLQSKIAYFVDLFSVIHLCRNQDQSAVGYMTQSKQLINNWLEIDNDQRVDNSYDLMMRINQDYRRINGHYRGSRLKEFLSSVEKIEKRYGIVTIQSDSHHDGTLH